MPEAQLPTRCDVLVVGAGPAGSACAQALARADLDVLLADQHTFPRDKVCGDGLIPDTHVALRRLGVYEEVADLAQHATHVRCVSPRGGHVDVPGTLSVLPRRELDHVLVRAAERAGARLLAPARFEAPLQDGDRVVGARLRTPQGDRDISAHWVVLATGAVPQALAAAGMCMRQRPSAVALRGYVHAPALAGQIAQLQVVWHRQLRGGYGWIFPAPGGVFNIGAGVAHGSDAPNLRQVFDAFCALYAPAAALMKEGRLQGEIKGAPLRCSLQGARWSRPGLLVAGEAAGTTYAFTGEGIGKALESGLLAAEALQHGRQAADEVVCQRHEAGLAALKPRFDIYDRAGRVNQHPWLADLVVWRARRSPRILRRMTGVLEETQNPGRLFTFSGLTKLILE